MNILGAPTSLGNRPYEDNGQARLTNLGPARLREQRVVERLGARDLGDVAAAEYRDFIRPPRGIRNEDLILEHVRAVARVVEAQDDFTLVLGGDCSVLLGALLGLSRGRDLGLVYIDAHSDFNTIESSETGGVAGMDLALATGRGSSELARLRGERPLVSDADVVAVGVRAPDGDFARGMIPVAPPIASEVLSRLGDRDFFVHLDVDAIDPSFMPFVDTPERGGLDPATLQSLLAQLVRHPRAVGMEVTIYDPRHDADSRGAALLADILEGAFGRPTESSRSFSATSPRAEAIP